MYTERCSASRVEAARSRCSFCHGELDAPARVCRSCSTALHENCWEDSGRCPTLGLRIRPQPASWTLLGAWLFAFSGFALLLAVVVPEIARLFAQMGITRASLTETVIGPRSLARSLPGELALLALGVGSTVFFMKRRARPYVREAFQLGTSLAFGLGGLIVYSMLIPLCQLTQKL